MINQLFDHKERGFKEQINFRSEIINEWLRNETSKTLLNAFQKDSLGATFLKYTYE